MPWAQPISPIVANLRMEEMEELAIIEKHAITKFYNLPNSIDPHINVTIEWEHNGQLSFLDTIVTHNNASLNINV